MLLRLYIDGDWSTWDFISLLAEMESLALFIEDGIVSDFLDRVPDVEAGDGKAIFHGLKEPVSRLTVSRISYGSPGSIDFLGIAKTTEQARLFLQYLIDLIIHRNDRELDRQLKILKIYELRLLLIQKIKAERPEYLALVEGGKLDQYLNLVDAGKVKSADTIKKWDT
jgi:hypothetical protein